MSDTPHPTVALEKLTKQQIAEMKAFQNPPVNVKMVMSSVLAALGQQETWPIGQRVLSDPNFLKKLREYDCDNLNPHIYRRLEEYVKLESYDPQILQRQSLAASELANWVILLVLWQKSPTKEAKPKILSSELKMKNPTPPQQKQKVPIKAQEKQPQAPVPQRLKVPIQKQNQKNVPQENQFQDLETVPVHLRPLIRRIIEQQVQERLQEEVANLQEEMRQQMGQQKMRNEEMINQQFQQKEESPGYMYPAPQAMAPQAMAPQAPFYPEQYQHYGHGGHYGHAGPQGHGPQGYFNPAAQFHQSFDYSQGFRYPSPVGRQRRLPEMYQGPNFYKKKPMMLI